MSRKKLTPGAILLLLPAFVYIFFFVTVTLGLMTAQSFGYFNYGSESTFTLKYWLEVFDKQFFDSLLFSLKVGVGSSLLSMCVCLPLAMLLQKTVGRKTMLSIFKMPVFIPALVCSFLIINLIDYHGIVNEFLMWIGAISEPLRMRNDDYGIGVFVIQVWKNAPYQLIIVYSALEAIRVDVKDSARNLGAGGWAIFRHIIFPLALPSVLVAVILVFIGTFGDFAITSTAGPLYPMSLSNLMRVKTYQFAEWNSAACVGVMVIVVTIICVALYTAIGNRLEKMK